MPNPGPCSICGELADDRCEQLTGPCCHVSVSWKDCVSGAYTRRIRAAAGLPVEWRRMFVPCPEHKLVKLAEAGYSIQACCGLCKNGEFAPGTDWGACQAQTKHTEPRQLSVNRAGCCHPEDANAPRFELDTSKARELRGSGFDTFALGANLMIGLLTSLREPQ